MIIWNLYDHCSRSKQNGPFVPPAKQNSKFLQNLQILSETLGFAIFWIKKKSWIFDFSENFRQSLKIQLAHFVDLEKNYYY